MQTLASKNVASTVDIDNLTIDTICNGVDKGWNIYQLSTMIGHSIAETCSILKQGAALNPKFAARIAPANWPTDLNCGHVYIGSFHTPVIVNPKIAIIRDRIRAHIKMRMIESDYDWMTKAKKLLAEKRALIAKTGGSIFRGERNNWVKPGSHIFAKPIKGKNYSEVFLPVSTRQRLFRFGHLVDGQFQQSLGTDGKPQKSSYLWLSKQDVLDGVIESHAAEFKYTKVEPSNSMRTVYTAGKTSMGTVHNNSIVAVKSDGT